MVRLPLRLPGTSIGSACGWLLLLLAVGTLVAPRSVGAADQFRALRVGGPAQDAAAGIATDVNGNLYLTGTFEGTVDVDPGPGTTTLTAPGSRTATFVLKLTSSGALVWAGQASGSAGSVFASGVAVDASGNVYVIGSLQGQADFDPGPGTASLTSVGTQDTVLWKLDRDGSFVWARQLGEAGAVQFGGKVTVDRAGDVVVAASYSGTIDFDPGPGTINLSSSGNDIFAWKLTPSGDLIWARTAAGGGQDLVNGVTTDADLNVLVAGRFSGTVDFDPSPSTSNLTAGGFSDGLVWKLSPAGDLFWARQVGGADADNTFGLAPGADGSLIAVGSFRGTVDFDPGAGATSATSADSDAYVLKLDALGAFVWVRTFGGAGTDLAQAVALDSTTSLYVAGSIGGPTTLDVDGEPVTFTPTGMAPAIFLKLGPGGEIAAASMLDAGSVFGARGIAVDRDGVAHPVGSYSGPATFSTPAGQQPLSNAGNLDAYIASLKIEVSPRVALGRDSVTTSEGAAPVPLAPAAVVADVDSPTFGGGTLTVDIPAGAEPTDRLAIRNEGTGPGQVGVSGTTVSLGGVAVGSVSGGAGAPLVVTLAPSASPATVQAILRNVTYQTLSQTPAPSRTVRVRFAEGTGLSSTPRTLVVNVTAVNSSPLAASDAFAAPSGAALVVPAPGVLANDTDPEADALTAAVVAGPARGSLDLLPNGGFSYRPSSEFVGTDTFTYRAGDGSLTSNPTTVTITVPPVSCTPRPRVRVAPSAGGGKLQVTVEATPLDASTNNRLIELRFGELRNARVTLDGQTVLSDTTVPAAPRAVALTFTLERTSAGQAATVFFTVVDECGPWPTFVGGGPNAF